MELRIENGRGKWHTLKSPYDRFYKALVVAMDAANAANRNMDPDAVQEMFYPVVMSGVIEPTRMFVTRIDGSHAYIVDRPVSPDHGAWVHINTLSIGGAKPKREVSPEQREKLAKNLEKARAARGQK